MANAIHRNTYNPALHFDVISGQHDIDFFLDRTLSFTLEDHARRYDEFRWTLDNRDGMLTAIHNIALGLAIRVRLGYADDTQMWRTFIISRMNGGVGVAQKAGSGMAAIGSGESTIEYTGRNRNAPDLRDKKKRKRGKGKKADPYVYSTKPTGRGGRLRARPNRGRPTQDITRLDRAQRDAWHGPLEGEQRIFHVRHVSDAIREIARRSGYIDERIFIQDTDDNVDHIIVPTGVSDAQYIEEQADKLNWEWKFDGNVCRFHEYGWKTSKVKPKTTFAYGGPDILSLSLDFDFNLPVPNSVKVVSHNPLRRGIILNHADIANSPIQNKVAIIFARGGPNSQSPDREQRRQHLLRDSVYNVSGGSKNLGNLKAQNEFVRRNIRAMRLTVQMVGNPDVEGGDTIQLVGTGCLLVDGDWYVDVARHIFSGTTYVTELDLRPPPKPKGASTLFRLFYRDPEATQRNLSGVSIGHAKGRNAVLRHYGIQVPGSAKTGGTR